MMSKDRGHDRGRQGTGQSVDYRRLAPGRSWLLLVTVGMGCVPYVARREGGHKIGRVGFRCIVCIMVW